MKTLVVTAAGALATLALFSTGTAGADNTGQTYAQVEKALKAQGYTVIQATSIGDQVPQAQCTVVKQLTTANNHVMLSLDCNKTPQGAGSH